MIHLMRYYKSDLFFMLRFTRRKKTCTYYISYVSTAVRLVEPSVVTNSNSSMPRCFRQTTISPQRELEQEKMASDALAVIVQEKTELLAAEQV